MTFFVRMNKQIANDLTRLRSSLWVPYVRARRIIRIASDDYLVKAHFLKLDSSHVQYVMDCMKDNTTHVSNIKKYLLAALYNASSTINRYYSSMVSHDLYGGGNRWHEKYDAPM